MLLQIGATLMYQTVHNQMLNDAGGSASSDLDLTVRIGCELQYETYIPTPAYMILRPRRSPTQRIEKEMLSFEPGLNSTVAFSTASF